MLIPYLHKHLWLIVEWHISWQENRKQEIDDQEISCRKLGTRKTGKTRKNKGENGMIWSQKTSTFRHFLQIIDNFYHFLSSSAWIKSYTIIFMTVSNLNKHLQSFLTFWVTKIWANLAHFKVHWKKGMDLFEASSKNCKIIERPNMIL